MMNTVYVLALSFLLALVRHNTNSKNLFVIISVTKFILGKFAGYCRLLKPVSAIFYQIFIFSPNDSPSKTMKNVFYFI